MILSASSSISSSHLLISDSTWVAIFSAIFNCSITFSSRSNIFMAYQRCCSSGKLWSTASSICASACSTHPVNLCLGVWTTLLLATSTALLAASITPVPFNAEISTTVQPSSLAKFLVFSLSPFFATISIIFTATTTGIPSSISWVVKYKFLSRLVPSMIFKITSGRSWIK